MVQTAITLLDMQVAAVWITEPVEPGSLIQSNCIDNECISLPFAHGVSVPGGQRMFGKRSPIRPDRARYVIPFNELQHPSGHLDDFNGLWIFEGICARETLWVALADGVISERGR